MILILPFVYIWKQQVLKRHVVCTSFHCWDDWLVIEMNWVSMHCACTHTYLSPVEKPNKKKYCMKHRWTLPSKNTWLSCCQVENYIFILISEIQDDRTNRNWAPQNKHPFHPLALGTKNLTRGPEPSSGVSGKYGHKPENTFNHIFFLFPASSDPLEHDWLQQSEKCTR